MVYRKRGIGVGIVFRHYRDGDIERISTSLGNGPYELHQINKVTWDCSAKHPSFPLFQPEKIGIWENKGEIVGRVSLDKPLPDAPLSEGFALNSLEDVYSFKKLNDLLWRAFHYEGEAPAYEDDVYLPIKHAWLDTMTKRSAPSPLLRTGVMPP
jgi:hypothetical protein